MNRSFALESARLRGTAAAIAAALLFGMSAPAAKVLLSTAEPLMLGAILYLGAGVGLSVLRLARPNRHREAPIRRADLPLLAGIAAAGAVFAPVLLLVGLRRVSAVTGSLALNLEGPLTVILAVLFFGEQLGARAAAGTFLIMLGAAVLSLAAGAGAGADVWGMLAIAGACLGWALDNNLTQRLSLRDPLAIVQIKGLLGGSIALALAVLIGNAIPPAGTVAWGLLIGCLSYGLSVVLAVYAMRSIGVAREAAFFATAPFIGAFMGVVLLGESFGVRELVALLVMLVGLGLLLRERHSHVHTHESMQHDHRHVHDEHHQHEHSPGDPPGEPHAHDHTHTGLEHEHPSRPGSPSSASLKGVRHRESSRLTESAFDGSSAVVRRLKPLVAMSLVLPLMGSGVIWTLAVQVLAHGDHHVSLHPTADGLAIVMVHETEHSHDHHTPGPPGGVSHDPPATHSHPHHQDHVVALCAPDPCAAASPQQLQADCGPAIALVSAIGFPRVPAPFSRCEACSRIGPPAPPRSSILRI